MWNKYTKEVALALKTVAPILLFLVIFSEGLLSNSVSAQTRNETDRLRTSDTVKDSNDVDIILHELGWTDLFDLEVVTVSKKKEKLFETASALFVVTEEDMRRSGATNIPDVLRMVPGVEVIRMDSARWYVSIRGYNHQYASKVLVLVDGRSVYAESLGGVLWKKLSSTLENIERIEVIRGPGSSIWGDDAVNGVINIITKNSADTQGDLITARWGNREDGASYTHGAKVGEETYYRASFEYDRYDWFSDGNDALGNWRGLDVLNPNQLQDDIKSFNGRFRIDSQLNSQNNLTIHVGGHDTKADQWEYDRVQPTPNVIENTEDTQGLYGSAKLEHIFSETSDMTLQFYIDHNDADVVIPLRIKETIFDGELDHRLIRNRHEILWGLGAKHIRDEVEDTDAILGFLKPNFDRKDSYSKYNLFLQDSVWLKPERLKVTIGVKWEHNSFTGSDYMPNLRLLYTPNERHAIWAAASKSSSVPGRYEIAGAFLPKQLPGGEGALEMEDPSSEITTSYELGYRARPSESLWFESAFFYQEIKHHLAMEQVPFTPPPPPPFRLQVSDCDEGTSYGAELAVSWDVNNRWKLKPTYSYFRGTIDPGGNQPAGQESPSLAHNVSNQFSIRSLYDVSDNIELDLWYKVVDGPGAIGGNFNFLDARINYEVKPNLNVSIVGQNLLDSKSEWLVDSYHEIERSFYVKLTWGL